MLAPKALSLARADSHRLKNTSAASRAMTAVRENPGRFEGKRIGLVLFGDVLDLAEQALDAPIGAQQRLHPQAQVQRTFAFARQLQFQRGRLAVVQHASPGMAEQAA